MKMEMGLCSLRRLGALVFVLVCLPAVVRAEPLEARIEALLAKMTLEEKIGQTALRGMSSRHKGPLPADLAAAVRAGRVGAFLNVMDRDMQRALQRLAVEESRLGVPLLFARDVIHGFRTVFPIPLGQAASWNPELAEAAARVAAEEAAAFGIRWTFAPMMDIARDPRWGRIAESFGEDPYLSERFAVAMVRGFQGEDLSRPTALAATAKHYAGYGAAEGGRDYNTTWIPELLLRNVYLRPFHAAVQAGVRTIMTGFNDLNGMPATGNRFLLQTVLRDEWGFDGFVVSDWESVTEMIDHGVAADAREAARLAAEAGLDMEMVSRAYEMHLADLIREGHIDEARLDAFVRRILRVKFELGLFERPYLDEATAARPLLRSDDLALARRAAVESMVLLKNDGDVLPLAADARIALIGPLADAGHEQLGTWTFDGRGEDAVTPLAALRERLGERLRWAPGLAYSRDRSRQGFAAAVEAARAADVVVFVGGEEAILSGEAHSRADIRLPGAQEALLRALRRTTKAPIVLVIMAGRPLELYEIQDEVDAILMAWHPGTMGGPALADVLFGEAEPSGRLPVTWPKRVGQIPIYYNHKNTGRPPVAEDFVPIDRIPVGAWQSSLGNDSHYLDLGWEPAFPFGYGLGYTRFEYRKLRLASRRIGPDDTLLIEVTVKNVGRRAGTDVVQLYVRDRVASLTRPVRELKRFARVTLPAGGSRRLRFELPARELAFYDAEGRERLEPGEFDLWVAPHAAAEGVHARFELSAP